MSDTNSRRIWGDLAYADRKGYWREKADILAGRNASAVLDALHRQPSGIRMVVVTLGESGVGAGHIAAALILREICCLDEIRIPPTQILAIPDRVSSREAYLSFQIAPDEVRGLLNAWRLRAAGTGKSPGNLTVVEQSLNRRAQRSAAHPRKGQIENLHLFFPAYRLVDGGALKTLASRDHLRSEESLPTLIFVDSLSTTISDIRSYGISPEWLVHDYRSGRLDDAEEAVITACEQFPAAKHLYLVPGLGHPLVNKLRGRGFRVCWLRDSPEGEAGAQLLEDLRCTTVEGSIGKENLTRLLELLEDATRTLRRSESHICWAAFNALRAAIALLTALPVDVRYYDNAALERYGVPTSTELLETLAGYEQELSSHSPSLASNIEEAASILRQCASNPDSLNERKTQLLSAVEVAIAESTGLCVVVRNRTTRAAVEAFLSDALETDLADLTSLGIRVEIRSRLRPEFLDKASPVLWTGYGGVQDLDTLLGFGYRRVRVMVNALERHLLARDIRSWTNRGVAAQQGTEALGITFNGKRQLLDNLNRFATEVVGTMAPYAPSSNTADISRLYEELVLKQESLSVPGTDARSSVLRPAIAVLFESDSTSFFPEHGIVTVIRDGETDPSEVSVGDLRVGDRVVFIDRDIGKTIYELMQEQLTQSPMVGAAAHIVSVWHRAAASAFVRSGLSVDMLHKELQRRGSIIKTTQTVRYWLRGAVIGPRDANDIDRLAATLSLAQRDPSVIEQIKESVRGLRNVYRQFAKIVYRTILAGGTGKALSDSEHRLLEEHGISLFDLKNAVTTDTIKRIGSRVEMRPAGLIGRDTNV